MVPKLSPRIFPTAFTGSLRNNGELFFIILDVVIAALHPRKAAECCSLDQCQVHESIQPYIQP